MSIQSPTSRHHSPRFLSYLAGIGLPGILTAFGFGSFVASRWLMVAAKHPTQSFCNAAFGLMRPPLRAPQRKRSFHHRPSRRGNTEQAFTIVGEDEADPSAGLLAWTAPLARSLADAAANEVVEFEAGGRTEPITVIGLATGDVA